LLLLAIPFAPMLTEWSAATEKVHQLQVEYFQYLTLGAGAVVLSNAMSSFYTGRGKTRIVMLVNVGGTLVNLVLDYLLIFGEFGFPEMGIKGAAIATTGELVQRRGVLLADAPQGGPRDLRSHVREPL
jgi:MATE family multidrug resistance protein